MQIIKNNLFTVILPDKGYKLVNKNTGKYYKKVILGLNDSDDNYGEVVDEKYVNMDFVVEVDNLKSTVKENTEQNELTIDLLLLSLDEMYTMVEPLLSMIPMTVENGDNGSKFINFYTLMVKRGLKNIEDVPKRFKEEVKKLL